MKVVPIYVLKKNLAAVLDEAEKGESVIVTRHQRPIARIVSVRSPYVHVPTGFGKSKFRSVGHALTQDQYLQVLQADRADNA